MPNTLFLNEYLRNLSFEPDLLPFKNEEIMAIDAEIFRFEEDFFNPDVERYLISKNEILTSFAISKAENSELSLKEAETVYNMVVNNKEYEFIGGKLRSKHKLIKKDHDKLEFYNIAKTFRELNVAKFRLVDLTPEFIRRLHEKITFGMDIFQKYLPNFTLYRSGQWRDSDNIRVGEYSPPPFTEIQTGLEELIEWYKKKPSPVSCAVFHTALYGLHPFNNGNKRVCRVLEHILLKEAGLNRKNLFSTSYYYHKQKERYYKQLLYSLERNNLNYFVSFVMEAIVMSIISVVKTSVEIKRSGLIEEKELGANAAAALRPLIKRREMQFKNLFKEAKRKMARQTFVTALEKAVGTGIALKREAGRTTNYRLNISPPEQAILDKWLALAKARLSFIPDEIKLA